VNDRLRSGFRPGLASTETRNAWSLVATRGWYRAGFPLPCPIDWACFRRKNERIATVTTINFPALIAALRNCADTRLALHGRRGCIS